MLLPNVLPYERFSDTVSLIWKIPDTVRSTALPPLRAVTEDERATSSASRALSAHPFDRFSHHLY